MKCDDTGYPHPDDVTPEVQKLIDEDSEMDRQRRQEQFLRAFKALVERPKALERLDDILDHTITSEDGERLFIKVEDAAEVYTLLFMAWSAGAEMVDDLLRYMPEEKDKVITGVQLVTVTEEDGETVKFEEVDAPEEVHIQTDWT